MILSLDPSSMAVGWACLAGPQELVEAGIIRPTKSAAPALDRIRSMLVDVRELLDTHVPEHIVIEVTSGKVGLHRHHGHGAGLGVYGMAVGAVWQACECWAAADLFGCGPRPQVHAIPENDWTRRLSKWKRLAAVASEFLQYNPAADPGGDMGDAIGLACWFLRERDVCLGRRRL